MKAPSFARILKPHLSWLLPMALIWSCMEPSPEVHYLSLKLEDSVTLFQRVRIVLLEAEPGTDTVEVLWDDSLPDVDRFKKVRTQRYRGGDALVVIRGFNNDQFLYERRITYHSASKTARIDSPRVKDTLAPVYSSRIPADTLFLRSWREFPDSLVQCKDARDGVLKPLLDTIARDVQLPSWYITIVYCRDLARNSTWRYGDTLMVYMNPWPRPGKPVIALPGRDSLDLPLGSAYSKEASCQDREDGNLPVGTDGDVNPKALGKYAVTYRCMDRDSNETLRKQIVWISDSLDTDPPVATLIGPDSIDHQLGEPYVDSGGTCVDLRDGPRPMLWGGGVDVETPGVYSVEFKCRDVTGNTAYPIRRVRVVSYAIAPSKADAITDTTAKSNVVSVGLVPILNFGKMKPVPDPNVIMLAFDLGGVRRQSLKSARAFFKTFISAPYTGPLDSLRVVFQVHRIKSPWVAGTGNWYFNRGYYQNHGHVILKNHPVREEVRAKSTDPAVSPGFTKKDVAIVRIPNMDEAGTDTVIVSYHAENVSGGATGTIPEKRHLVPLEIDLTRYVKETPEGEDYGLVITTEGVPENAWIGWATKDLGDGSMAPYLKLFY